MEPSGVERKLIAILNADVQGYSRLMGDDEAATVRTLTAYRDLMSNLVRQHGGRVVDMTGDNLLAEFASVVGAVRCAVEVQEELKARNAELPDHRKMDFRIGINLGDVIVEGERIYGDGVNVAARVQSLAEGGGIAISGTVYDQIENKLALRYESLGEHAVKNIAKPVRVYRVLMEPKVTRARGVGAKRWRWAALAAVIVLLLGGGGAAIWSRYLRPSPPPGLELPDKPSIAVLPFTNLSGDPKQAHFADGMTEELITTLSKVSGLFVIASNSVFTYKGKPVKVQEVSRELGVRYVLEGSIRKADNRMRVAAQLIDATTGRHLWAERYDRELKDVFAVQDEITRKIVTAMEVKLTEGEQARIRRQGTNSVEAWEAYVQGLEALRRITREGNAEAERMTERAVALDPKFAVAWTLLGHTHMLDALLGWSPSPARSLERAVELAQKAIALDDSLGEPYMTLSQVYLIRRQHALAIEAGERSVALNPNSASVTAFFARTLAYSGREEEAIEVAKRAMRLAPLYPSYYLAILGQAYHAAGRYEEAVAAFKRYGELNPENTVVHVSLAVSYGRWGREAEARAAVTDLLRRDPGWAIERAARARPYKNPADLERDLDALRKAGLK